MAQLDKVKGIFANLDSYVGNLKTLAAMARQDFLADFRNIESTKHLMQVSIECCLDTAHHIIAREQFRAPKNYAESFEILVKQGIIPNEFLPTLRQMVNFRNRLVHLYWEIDAEFVYDEILQKNLGDFDTFVRHVLNYIQEKP